MMILCGESFAAESFAARCQSSSITTLSGTYRHDDEPLVSRDIVGVFNRDQPWTGLVIVMLIFCVDFLLHILFASLDWKIPFLLVAIEIALISHAVGPITLIIGGQRNRSDQNIVMKIGVALSIPLTMGFWWAVNDMSWANWIATTILFPAVLHLSLWKHSSWLTSLFWTSEG